MLTKYNFLFIYFFFKVYADGGICLDILQNRWSPTYDVSAILTSIQVNVHFDSIFSSIHFPHKTKATPRNLNKEKKRENNLRFLQIFYKILKKFL